MERRNSFGSKAAILAETEQDESLCIEDGYNWAATAFVAERVSPLMGSSGYRLCHSVLWPNSSGVLKARSYAVKSFDDFRYQKLFPPTFFLGPLHDHRGKARNLLRRELTIVNL